MNYSACHELGTNKKSESPTGFKPKTSQTPGGCSMECFHSRGQYLCKFIGTKKKAFAYVVLCGKRMKDGKF